MNTKNDCHNQKWCSSNTPPQHQAQFHFFSAPLSQLAYKFPTKKKEFSGSERSFSDHFLLICFTLGAVQLALIDGIRVRGSPLILLRHSGVARNYIFVFFSAISLALVLGECEHVPNWPLSSCSCAVFFSGECHRAVVHLAAFAFSDGHGDGIGPSASNDRLSNGEFSSYSNFHTPD